MSDVFDPYHKWLGIPPEEQPPDYYRLLGVGRFESDGDVIDNAANQRMTHLRTFQTGQHSEQSQQLLNEIASARICLLDAEKKLAYDTQLKQSIASAAPPLQAPPVVEPQPGIQTAHAVEASTPQPILPEQASPLDQPLPSVRPTPKRSSARRYRRPRTQPWVLPVAICGVSILLLIVIAIFVFLR